ncbi:hypothetical protein [Fluviicola sp.]|uniref:hypothetical protein n=1 Tax=Fluviicola sp. TaxID=1917219 RepID=UPI003D2D8248
MKFSMIALLTFLSIGFNGLADCAGTGLNLLPSQKEIKKTSLFLLEGYAESQHVITDLNTKYPIYLKSGNERIPLEVIETHVGQFYLTQVLLKPKEPLTPGKEYQVVIENLPDYENFGNYNSKTNKYDPITYLIKETSDEGAPQWIEAPKEKDKSLVHYGCGPSIMVNFTFTVKDASDIWVLTTVKSKETGTTISYILSMSESRVSIGHGMCAGAFTFNEGTDYEVQFSLMDSLGNKSEKASEWITFTKPVN